MVGDSIDDMTAGHRAGAATVLLVNPANEHLSVHEHTDLVVSRLDELVEVLEDGFVGREEVSEGEEERGAGEEAAGKAKGKRRLRKKSGKVRKGPERVFDILKALGPGIGR